MAPQAISIFSSDGEKLELPDEAKTGIEDNEKEKKPALSMTCDLTESGKNIKKLLESVIKTPLKYVRYMLRFVGSRCSFEKLGFDCVEIRQI